jgi:hypothetical protein
MKRLRAGALLITMVGLGALAPAGKAQIARDEILPAGDVASLAPVATQPQRNFTYTRPTERTKLRSYFFDAFGPYPIAGAAILAGISQADNTPPEWGQGAKAYGERIGSDFGIALVTTTTRYALAEAFREDTLYYRCDCNGMRRRLGHAVISTVTARRGVDGRRGFSLSALLAPYAGSMTAVYGWYPGHYGTKDGFRMGNYALLAFAGENIAREFIYGGSHTLFSHIGRSAAPSTDSAANSTP